jgi:WD40 repeat protein
MVNLFLRVPLAAQQVKLPQGICLSPDGAYLGAIIGGRLTVFRVATFEQIWETPDDSKLLPPIAFSPDGEALATGIKVGRRGTFFQLFETGTGRLVKALGTPGRAIGVSRDKKRLLAQDDYGLLKLWDVNSGLELRTLRIMPPGRIFSTEIGHLLDDERTFVRLNSSQRRIEVWDLQSESMTRTILVGDRSVPETEDLAKLNDVVFQAQVEAASSPDTRMQDSLSNLQKKIKELRFSGPTARGGNRLFALRLFAGIGVVDLQDGSMRNLQTGNASGTKDDEDTPDDRPDVERPLSAASLHPMFMQASHDGMRLLACEPRGIALWNVAEGAGTLLKDVPGMDRSDWISLSHDGKRIAFVKGTSIGLYDCEKGAVVGWFQK